jgi:hypothetical protein
MYNEPRQEKDSFTTLGTDLNNDKTGQVVESFKLNLEKAKATMDALNGTANGKTVSLQIAKAFDAAERIIHSARIAQRQNV